VFWAKFSAASRSGGCPTEQDGHRRKDDRDEDIHQQLSRVAGDGCQLIMRALASTIERFDLNDGFLTGVTGLAFTRLPPGTPGFSDENIF
jgi:hypothetical protein